MSRKLKCCRREILMAGFFYEQKGQNNKPFAMSK